MITQNDLRTLVAKLGGDIHAGYCSVPGPGHSRDDRSVSVKLEPRAPDGFLVKCFASDDPLDVKDYIRDVLGLPRWQGKKRVRQAVAQPVVDPGPDLEQEKRKAWALKIWEQSVNPKDTLAEYYLREHRGLELDTTGGVIRFHYGLKFGDAYVPAMVCLMRNIVTDEPCGIHRTFLDRNTGQKIDRKMLGIAKGAAIKLDPISTKLTIGEGMESVLSARAMGLGPVWALGSSGAVGRFPVLEGLSELIILEENDATSWRDVAVCRHRYLTEQIAVRTIKPSVGNDLNDTWRAMR